MVGCPSRHQGDPRNHAFAFDGFALEQMKSALRHDAVHGVGIVKGAETESAWLPREPVGDDDRVCHNAKVREVGAQIVGPNDRSQTADEKLARNNWGGGACASGQKNLTMTPSGPHWKMTIAAEGAGTQSPCASQTDAILVWITLSVGHARRLRRSAAHRKTNQAMGFAATKKEERPRVT